MAPLRVAFERGPVRRLSSPDARLNFFRFARDQGWKPLRAVHRWGNQSVKIVRPNTTDPIPQRASAPKMGTIMVRFAAILSVAVALLALLWSR
jgi:hypothetical protein